MKTMKTMETKKTVSVRSGFFRLQAELCYNREAVITSEAYDVDQDICFRAGTRTEAVAMMKTWLDDQVAVGKVKELIWNGHNITWDAPDLLPSMRQSGVGFHVTLSKHRESVLGRGLEPNGTEHISVQQASRIMDELKPAWIPDWVSREEAVYLHPVYKNQYLTNECDNCDLFAVAAPTQRAWMGSIGLGGLCLFDEDRGESWAKRHTERIQNEYGPAYWKYSCSYEEYQRSSSYWKVKDQYAKSKYTKNSNTGLDEVLICEPIPASRITHIGSWKNGIFLPTTAFRDFVKPHLRSSYKEILESYFGPASLLGASPASPLLP